MSTHVNETERRRSAYAISVWENEGGASGGGSLDEQFGRRIEADRSWTVYHVFTGVPAQADGEAMTGLSRLDATDGMLTLNRRKSGHHQGRGSLAARSPLAQSTTKDCRHDTGISEPKPKL